MVLVFGPPHGAKSRQFNRIHWPIRSTRVGFFYLKGKALIVPWGLSGSKMIRVS